MSTPTVLVTGATGGLGRNAVEYLLRRGLKVRATGRNEGIGAALQRAGADFHAEDLARRKFTQLEKLVHGVDAVWHCAALSSPWGAREDFMAANVRATEAIIHAAARNGVNHFVHISTPALYFDFQHHRNITEGYRPARYVNHYAETKALAEDLVQDCVKVFPKMNQVILRPRAIFGPHDQVLVPRLSRILHQTGGKLPLPRGGETVLDMTYVDNVVHAMWLATYGEPVPSGSVYNITNGEPEELRNVLQFLYLRQLGEPFAIRNVPYPVLATAARAMEFAACFTGKEPKLTRYSIGALAFDMTLDISKARNELGYRPVISLEDGVRRTAEWMKKSWQK